VKCCVVSRPFFTYWVTFVQIVCFIISVAVFGIATVSGAMTTISDEVCTQPELILHLLDGVVE